MRRFYFAGSTLVWLCEWIHAGTRVYEQLLVGAGGGGWEWGGRHFSRETVLCRCIYVGTADSTLARHILIG